jgi:hypothetical protein
MKPTADHSSGPARKSRSRSRGAVKESGSRKRQSSSLSIPLNSDNVALAESTAVPRKSLKRHLQDMRETKKEGRKNGTATGVMDSVEHDADEITVSPDNSINSMSPVGVTRKNSTASSQASSGGASNYLEDSGMDRKYSDSIKPDYDPSCNIILNLQKLGELITVVAEHQKHCCSFILKDIR